MGLFLEDVFSILTLQNKLQKQSDIQLPTLTFSNNILTHPQKHLDMIKNIIEELDEDYIIIKILYKMNIILEELDEAQNNIIVFLLFSWYDLG